MDIRGYIGVDFGTANSHFAYCEIEGETTRATVIELDGAENRLSVPSFLLWELSDKPSRIPRAYGAPAVEEWMLADDDENGGSTNYLLTGAFKPDLATSPMSQEAAREFLAFARKNMEATHTPRGLERPGSWPVIVGVPAAISSEHRARTEQAAKEAGFDDVSCLEEPLGAVGYHLAAKQIDDDDLDRGVVVVDFGGGTLDLATVDRSGVKEPWGDPQLGGRLFDDLFFQWVVDASRVDLRDFNRGELLAIWWMNCRRLKENFSRHWKSKLAKGEAEFSNFKGRVETRDGSTFGSLRGVSLNDFLERAKSYQPSALAKDYFKQIHSPLQHLGESGPVDLLEKVRDVIAGGSATSHGTVILTGGSSSWPFMEPMVREVFGDCEILIPNAPECTIGEGLAMYNVLGRNYHARQDKAVADVGSLKSALDKVIKDATDQAGSDIAEEIVGAVMQVARREFHAWHLKGGRLADVEKLVTAGCRDIPAREIVAQRVTRLLPEVEEEGTWAVRNWLVRHGIKGDYEGLHLDSKVPVSNLILNVSISDDLAGSAVSQAAGLVSGAIVVGLFAVIAATGVTMAASPLVFLVPFLAAGVFMNKQYVKEQLLEYEFKGNALEWLQKLYSEDRLEESLSKGESECQSMVMDTVAEAMNGIRAEMDPLMNDALEEVRRRYGLLDRLSQIESIHGHSETTRRKILITSSISDQLGNTGVKEYG